MKYDTRADALMWAIQQRNWGGMEQLELVEIERPQPLPTEVRVRVKAAGINPVDVFTREGKAYMRALTLPHVPGWDICGVVDAIGYGVTRFKPGDEVFGMPWFPRQAGAYAQYVCAPSGHLALKPRTLCYEAVAALPLAGLSAWQMLVDVAATRPGDRILINAAAGGVGHLAVQIAKRLGAYVLACTSREKHAFVRTLGADEVIDYTVPGAYDAIGDLDTIIELVGGDICLRLLRCLRKGGLLISAQAAWAPNLRDEAAKRGVRATWFLVEPDRTGLEHLARLVDEGALRVHLASKFPLAEAGTAQELIARRKTMGKIVLTL
ncbi:NADP-dependent oxidoreductase [Labrys sp. ZIDIC5]|uniref:NADP-dependent oxidoreductase n=1 Tax=Labrys sedimenti TaxID=3106036 RepID=UPI002AC9F5C3|nr:NADP-dependent oxidoreductase [Labrys sp. ZIDIC5]MDZ5454426.1 NADP-dependent oxidoreductase [Labrys sp. ZIDIC5]